MRSLKLWFALLMVLVLSACAQAPKKLAYNAAGAGHIKTVLITQSPDQTQYEAEILAHPGKNHGLVGALIAATDTKIKSDKLTAAIGAEKTKLQSRFTEQLVTKLTAQGYRVLLLPVGLLEKEPEIFAKVKAMPEKPDALLWLTVKGRYVAAGAKSDYFPEIKVEAKMYDVTRNNEPLFLEDYAYGYTVQSSKDVQIPSDEKYRYNTHDLLIAQPDQTRQGLLDGVDLLVNQIVNDLKR